MERLRVEAHAKGGVVLSNLGNHEWMNAIGTLVGHSSHNLILIRHVGDWRRVTTLVAIFQRIYPL
jgi:hypothetical protein